jgi:ribosomal-protein-alanine N-acetyltransferase
MAGTSQRVLLWPLSAADQADFLAGVARSRGLHRPWVAPPSDSDRFATLLAARCGPVSHGFVLRAADNGALVGYLELTNIVRGLFQNAYLGYYAFEGHQGRGLMREGLLLLARRAFGPMKLHRIEANIQPGNAASIALVQACGFRKEGFSPKYLKIRGRWCDHERWALLSR